MPSAREWPAVAALFREADEADRLELLIEFGAELPPLDPAWCAVRDAGRYLVLECQSPVFFAVSIEAGRTAIHADVPVEAAVARGFVGLLIHLFDGVDPGMVREAPGDPLEALGLAALLGLRRRRGLGAIYGRLKEGAGVHPST
jgi:cysteine desulfuration protein SufE